MIRWKNKLESGEILSVYVRNPRTHTSESFYVRLSKNCRFTVPRIIVERIEAEPGDVLEVTLYPETHE